MGWSFPYLSSMGSDFTFDYGVSFTPDQMTAGKVDYNYRSTSFPMSEAPGISVFLRDGVAGSVQRAACFRLVMARRKSPRRR